MFNVTAIGPKIGSFSSFKNPNMYNYRVAGTSNYLPRSLLTQHPPQIPITKFVSPSKFTVDQVPHVQVFPEWVLLNSPQVLTVWLSPLLM